MGKEDYFGIVQHSSPIQTHINEIRIICVSFIIFSSFKLYHTLQGLGNRYMDYDTLHTYIESHKDSHTRSSHRQLPHLLHF